MQFESLYPIIKAKIDSIGQKLTSVNFHIPKDLIEVNSSYNISYDVKKLPSEGGIAPYPERKLSIAGEPVDVRLDLIIDEYLWVYGFVVKETKDTTILYDSFELEVSLK